MSKEGNQEIKSEPLSVCPVGLTHQVSGHKWEIHCTNRQDLGTHLLTHSAVLKQSFSSLEEREIKKKWKICCCRSRAFRERLLEVKCGNKQILVDTALMLPFN